jgi:hypothetical protein
MDSELERLLSKQRAAIKADRIIWLREYMRRRRAAARANGICIVCLAEQADPGYATCLACQTKRANRRRTRRQSSL